PEWTRKGDIRPTRPGLQDFVKLRVRSCLARRDSSGYSLRCPGTPLNATGRLCVQRFGLEPMKILFGDCVLELATRQLWRDGKIVPLEPKMYELLDVLIQRRPAVVTNNELDEILWPQVYVARTSLTRLVSELRSVLGDTPRESRIIRTVYKTGYAFCANVTSSVPPTSAPAGFSLQWNERLIPLSDGEHIAGRGAECSVVIDAGTVSRRHAR